MYKNKELEPFQCLLFHILTFSFKKKIDRTAVTFQFGTEIITTATKMRLHLFLNQGRSSQKLLLLSSVQDIIHSC